MRNRLVTISAGCAVALVTAVTCAGIGNTPGHAQSRLFDGSSGDAEVRAALRAAYDMPLRRKIAGRTGGRNVVRVEEARLTAVLHSFGYLEGSVTLRRDRSVPDGLAGAVSLGPRYPIAAINVAGIEDQAFDEIRPELGLVLRKFIGQPASGGVLQSLEHEMLWNVLNGSFPFASVESRSLVAHRDLSVAEVRLDLDPGPKATFGPFISDDLDSGHLASAASMATFAPGDPYSPKAVDDLVDRLEGLPSIRTVRIEVAATPDTSGQVPLRISLREAPPDPRDLAEEGRAGLFLMVAVLATIALRRVAASGEAWRRWIVRPLALLAIVLALCSAILLPGRLAILTNPPSLTATS